MGMTLTTVGRLEICIVPSATADSGLLNCSTAGQVPFGVDPLVTKIILVKSRNRHSNAATEQSVATQS